MRFAFPSAFGGEKLFCCHRMCPGVLLSEDTCALCGCLNKGKVFAPVVRIQPLNSLRDCGCSTGVESREEDWASRESWCILL